MSEAEAVIYNRLSVVLSILPILLLLALAASPVLFFGKGNAVYPSFLEVGNMKLEFSRALKRPIFTVTEVQDLDPSSTRLTLILLDRRIEKVFYPVFSPETKASEVLDWLHRSL